jgi:hypothetical protein
MLAQDRLGVDQGQPGHRHAGDDGHAGGQKMISSSGDCLIVDAMLISVAIARDRT